MATILSAMQCTGVAQYKFYLFAFYFLLLLPKSMPTMQNLIHPEEEEEGDGGRGEGGLGTSSCPVSLVLRSTFLQCPMYFSPMSRCFSQLFKVNHCWTGRSGRLFEKEWQPWVKTEIEYYFLPKYSTLWVIVLGPSFARLFLLKITRFLQHKQYPQCWGSKKLKLNVHWSQLF